MVLLLVTGFGSPTQNTRILLYSLTYLDRHTFSLRCCLAQFYFDLNLLLSKQHCKETHT